jgi:type III pantothenate kinase
MNLVVDIGNTSTKIAFYKGNAIIKKERLKSPDTGTVGRFIGKTPVRRAIVSSVNHDPSALTNFLRDKGATVHLLSCKSRFPFTIAYETPETMGVDRLAAAAGAFLHHPGEDLLVIDAGSALTLDVVTGGSFLGGSISPGLSMRFRALHEFTGRLPLIDADRNFTFPGKTTKDAITGGVVMGLVFEINEYIRTFEKRHVKLVTVITGGDSEIITSFTDRKMFLHPDLVTDGLNFLLDYNVQDQKT